jgi:glycine/D-amino acid oxidase-like deaminating enzyme
MTKLHAVMIGAGFTGAAIAHDLALRALRLTLVERFGPAAGTTGHIQAQLHSGARYAAHHPESARMCTRNIMLRRIMPDADPEVRSPVKPRNGVWRCHSAFECTEVWPVSVGPVTAIMNLRTDLLISVIRRKGN